MLEIPAEKREKWSCKSGAATVRRRCYQSIDGWYDNAKGRCSSQNAVVRGLIPHIHVLLLRCRTWLAGKDPAMTDSEVYGR